MVSGVALETFTESSVRDAAAQEMGVVVNPDGAVLQMDASRWDSAMRWPSRFASAAARVLDVNFGTYQIRLLVAAGNRDGARE